MNLDDYRSLSYKERFYVDLAMEIAKQITDRLDETNELLKTIIALDHD
jgi:hypothetical protein